MSSEVDKFIKERLLGASNYVSIIDIAESFKLDINTAKKELYAYYSNTKTAKGNCTIICEYNNGSIKLLHDNDEVQCDKLQDMFIYGISPSEDIRLQKITRDHPTITPAYKLVLEQEATIIEPKNTITRSKTSVPEQTTLQRPSRGSRNTFPGTNNELAKFKGKKNDIVNTGLRSTAILERMRDERELKERKRLDELRKRREQSIVISDQKKEQMEKLAKLFDSDTNDNVIPKYSQSDIINQDKEKEFSKREEQLDQANTDAHLDLEALLETTADDSLVMSPHSQETKAFCSDNLAKPDPSIFVDNDGYIVTTRAQRPSVRLGVKRTSKLQISPISSQAGTNSTGSNKKVQTSLNSFFRKK